jgi:hypothetical protein
MRSAKSKNILEDFSITNCMALVKKKVIREASIEFDHKKIVPNLKNFLVKEFEGKKKLDFKLEYSYLRCLLLSLFNFH